MFSAVLTVDEIRDAGAARPAGTTRPYAAAVQPPRRGVFDRVTNGNVVLRFCDRPRRQRQLGMAAVTRPAQLSGGNAQITLGGGVTTAR